MLTSFAWSWVASQRHVYLQQNSRKATFNEIAKSGDKFALSLAKNSHLSFPPSHFWTKTQVGEGHACCLPPIGEKLVAWTTRITCQTRKEKKASNLFDTFEGIKSRKFAVEIEQKMPEERGGRLGSVRLFPPIARSRRRRPNAAAQTTWAYRYIIFFPLLYLLLLMIFLLYRFYF